MLLSFLALRGLAVGAKDAFQLLVSACSVECAVSLREGYKDAFQLLVSALERLRSQ